MNTYLCNNPAILQRADPSILLHGDGYYYFTGSVPEFNRIELRRAKDLANLGGAESHVIWRKPSSGEMCAKIWAPEIHHIGGKWYIYFAAAHTEEPVEGMFTHRMYVLENPGANPLEGEWLNRGRIVTEWESFSLDATTFVHRGIQYLVWAQNDPAIKGNSNLYISAMANPWTLRGKTVRLSVPEYNWETKGFLVNEGPAILARHGRIFLTYSCSATDENYCMGMLHAEDTADLLDPDSWTKSPHPVFETDEGSGQYGPGHNCFTVSEDGQTDLLVYHARNYRGIIGDPLGDPNRHTRIQPVAWTSEGFPDFISPVRDGPLYLERD